MFDLSISLCMIVKNEEDHLDACLESVHDLVKEIIIVDTGSTDRTVDIARRFGATIIEAPWRHDFAHARNIGLEQAKGEWILFLDADERLDRMDREKLAQLASLRQFEGFFLNIYNYGGDGQQGASVNPVLRMFKNRPGYRFQGRIHEQTVGPILAENPRARFQATDIRIHHIGYLAQIVAKKNKIVRNVRLLQQTLKETPNDPFHWYNLGVEYVRMNQPTDALIAFQKSRSLIQAPLRLSYAHLVYKYEIRCFHLLDRHNEAAERLEKALALFPSYTDLYHLKGQNRLHLGKIDEAKNAIRRAIELGPAPPPYHTEEGIGSYQSCFLLGQIEEECGNATSAVDCYLAAIQFKSSLTPPLYRIFRIFKCTGQEKIITEWIKNRLHLAHADAVRKVTHILVDTHCFHAALSLLEEFKTQLSEVERQLLKILCFFHLGRVDEARALLPRLLTRFQSKKATPAWLRIIDAKQTSFPTNQSDNETKRAIELAYSLGNRRAAMSLLDDWSKELQAASEPDPQRWRTLSRAVVSLADMRLNLVSDPTDRQAIQTARLKAPFVDGR